ncbi:DUF4258 domain-containing protein [uncultured Acetobacterium sp.]|uniref:DUF4258 domain-containing protein n=1 Tax=uncultured Acetobacterium sp. TaxID=217139 RepID=UPI0025E7725A|nr:DUF4258 domain-containing protein [uncultured Acetobacterium sp.]
MKIEDLRDLYEKDIVFLTQHVIERCKQRNIRPKHIKEAVMTGEIIEDYPDDFPTPSCLILGFPSIGVPLHVVVARKETERRPCLTLMYSCINLFAFCL